MSVILQQLRAECAKMYEYLEPKVSRIQTASEEIVSQKLQFLHEALKNVEAKVVVIEADVAKEIRTILADVKSDKHILVTKLDAEIEAAEKATKQLEAEMAQRQKNAAPVSGHAEPPATPAETAPEVSKPAAAPEVVIS